MKKPFKQLAKSAKKSRKKNGLTNAISQANITIQPEDLKRTDRMLRDATALNGMVNFIRQERNEIDEDLDSNKFLDNSDDDSVEDVIGSVKKNKEEN